MPTGFCYSDRFLDHDPGPSHPERPERLRAIVDKLRRTGQWDRLTHLPFEPAPLAAIEAVHDDDYIRRIETACRTNSPYIDSVDSGICPASYEVALLAAGAGVAAVDAVMAGEVDNAFCAVRPPGHHAERGRSMGFCLFDNIAVAAEHLVRAHGLERVAIVDFDVHHGNGTQHIFEHRSDVLFVSLHEHPMYLYPGSGFAYEVGRDEGTGFTLNLPMDPNAADDHYRHAMLNTVMPRLAQFDPEFVLISAGFDATADDPLAHLALSPQGYQWIARQLLTVAQRHCAGRVVSLLEGGYDLRSLAECVSLHVQTLLDAHHGDDHMAMKAGF
jgi:acetoin utilization deacetylase AcuC-like enzyme